MCFGKESVSGLVFTRRSKAVPKWFAAIALVVSLAVAGVITWTANLGGQIRHTEIRSGVSAPGTPDGDADDDNKEKGEQERKGRDDH
jgi:hypothetical protein